MRGLRSDWTVPRPMRASGRIRTFALGTQDISEASDPAQATERSVIRPVSSAPSTHATGRAESDTRVLRNRQVSLVGRIAQSDRGRRVLIFPASFDSYQRYPYATLTQGSHFRSASKRSTVSRGGAADSSAVASTAALIDVLPVE